MNQRVVPQLLMTSWERSRAFNIDASASMSFWEDRFEPGFLVFTQLTRDGLPFFPTEHTGDYRVGNSIISTSFNSNARLM